MRAQPVAKPRHHIRTPVAYWGPDIEGGGTLANISYTGALIEPASPAIPPGTPVTVSIPYFHRTAVELSSLELVAKVVRQTDAGFAILFDEVGPDANRVLSELLYPEVIDLTDVL